MSSPERPAVTPQVIVIMGVSGSGKTTIGKALARALEWPFRDADEFHSPGNIAKMSSGVPLTDEDRAPWLRAIRIYIDEQIRAGSTAVVTCSALKQRYRDALLGDPVRVRLVYLKGSTELLEKRISERMDHFMKPGMLQSQLAALEEPADALCIDIAEEPEEIVRRVRAYFGI